MLFFLLCVNPSFRPRPSEEGAMTRTIYRNDDECLDGRIGGISSCWSFAFAQFIFTFRVDYENIKNGGGKLSQLLLFFPIVSVPYISQRLIIIYKSHTAVARLMSFSSAGLKLTTTLLLYLPLESSRTDVTPQKIACSGPLSSLLPQIVVAFVR